jgi:hypothetical protein
MLEGVASLNWREICRVTSEPVATFIERYLMKHLGQAGNVSCYLPERVPSGVRRNNQLSQRPKRRHGYFSFLVTKCQTDYVPACFRPSQTILNVHFEIVLLSLDRDKHVNRSSVSTFRQRIAAILPLPDHAVSGRANVTEQNRSSNYHRID